MNRCNCNPVQEPFEYPIYNINLDKYKKQKKIFLTLNNIQELKEKIICEYLEIIDKLECGIKLDLEFLLREISIVYINDGRIY